jgi:hypothetical protein
LLWLKLSGSVTANNTISPIGIQDADKFVENTLNDEHVIYRSIIGTSKTFSFYAKAAGRDWVAVLSNNGNYTFFNIANGTLGTVAATSTAKIENAGNGWYRCTVYNTHPSFGATINLATANGTTVYTGNGTSGIFLWGAQLEVGSYATSLIPTQNSSVTRNADVISKTGISSLIGQTEGTFFVESIVGNATSEIYFFAQNSLGSSVEDSIYFQKDGNAIKFVGWDGYDIQWNISGGTFTKGQRVKIAGAYKANDIVLYINGTQIGVDSSATLPPINSIQLGNFPADLTSNNDWAKYINSAVIWKTRLTNSELAQLTTI